MFTVQGAAPDVSPYTAADEQAVAAWVYRNNKHAGATTDTLPGAKCLYLAVRSQASVFAVVGVALSAGEALEVYDRNLLLAMLNEFALALEHRQAAAARSEMLAQARQEQLRANLLRAISHDLRTPLTGISGNANILMRGAPGLKEEKKQRLYTDIYDDSMWLMRLVENVLAVTRIENGSVQLSLEAELVEEVAQEALRHLSRHSGEHAVKLSVQGEMLMARMDPQLIAQVLVNLADNAVRSAPGATGPWCGWKWPTTGRAFRPGPGRSCLRCFTPPRPSTATGAGGWGSACRCAARLWRRTGAASACGTTCPMARCSFSPCPPWTRRPPGAKAAGRRAHETDKAKGRAEPLIAVPPSLGVMGRRLIR